jgi:hypothetical protein
MVDKFQITGELALKVERISSPSPWPTGATTRWQGKSPPNTSPR